MPGTSGDEPFESTTFLVRANNRKKPTNFWNSPSLTGLPLTLENGRQNSPPSDVFIRKPQYSLCPMQATCSGDASEPVLAFLFLLTIRTAWIYLLARTPAALRATDLCSQHPDTDEPPPLLLCSSL